MFQKVFKSIIFIMTGLLLSNCNQAPPVEPEAPKGVLRLVTVPTDMPIIINGQPKGNSPSGPGQYFQILLEEGEHNIEVLKPVDEEKEMYGDKKVFIASDTVQTVTVEAKQRLTPFGKEEKARLIRIETEKKKQIEDRKKERKRLESLAVNARINLNTNGKENKALAFSDDGAKLYAVQRGMQINEYDTITGNLSNSIIAKTPYIQFSKIDVENNILITSHADPYVLKAWDLKNSNSLWSNRNREMNVMNLSTDNQKLITGGNRGGAAIWDIKNGSKIISLPRVSKGREGVAFSNNGKYAVSITFYGQVSVSDASTGEGLSSFNVGDATRLLMSKNSTEVITYDYNNVTTWDLLTGSKKHSFKYSEPNIYALEMNPSGDMVAIGSGDGVITILSYKSGKILGKINSNLKSPSQIAFSPNGNQMAVSFGSFGDGQIIIFDLVKELSVK